VEELRHRVDVLEWTVDSDSDSDSDAAAAQQKLDIVKHRLQQPVKTVA